MRSALASRLKQSVTSGSIRFASFGPMSPMGPEFSPIPDEPGVEDAEVVEETSRPLQTES